MTPRTITITVGDYQRLEQKWLADLATAREFDAWKRSDGRRRDAHWHEGSGTRYWHDGKAWGAVSRGRWAWLAADGRRWWALAGGQPLVRHAGRWWWKSGGAWFLLHEGRALAYFERLRARGLFDPESGVRVVYSDDGRKAAIVSPEGEAEVVDLAGKKDAGSRARSGRDRRRG